MSNENGTDNFCDSAADLYRLLIEALSHPEGISQTYRIFRSVFIKIVDQNTISSGLRFGGTFAKTDYLLKAANVDSQTARRIHHTRARLRVSREMEADQLCRFIRTDLRNLSEFIHIIYNVEISDELRINFAPIADEQRQPQAKYFDCIRMIVCSFDETHIYGLADNFDMELKVRLGDWCYLCEMLRKGSQINLVNAKFTNGEIIPTLIIYEPDYLIDVSTIAGCFESYATSAKVNLLKKIQPYSTTKAITLGNFASKLLDESLTKQEPPTYNQSIATFFRENALSLLTSLTPEDRASFHIEAKTQQANINKAMRTTLPHALKGVHDPENGMVEPSFFCEMLGIQGRMDYLQLDFRLLIEQKSGKGAFPQGDYTTPRQTEQHYVQMLLYMLVLKYNFKTNYERMQAFLLYSKYSESLLKLDVAPRLIFQAIRVRNELAHQEIELAQPGGFEILNNLTADTLNEAGVNNPLWNKYQKPQIEELLSTIHTASPLERAYFTRFLTFIANEHVLSKVGTNETGNSGFASKWHDSLEDKLQAGNIYESLELVDTFSKSDNPVETLTFRFAPTQNIDMANFRQGDIAVAYPYDDGSEPDIRRQIVFRGAIECIDKHSFTFRLRAPQSNPHVFVKDIGMRWAVGHDFMESSFSSLYRGMFAFLKAPKRRRDLLMFQRAPESAECQSGDLRQRVQSAHDIFLIVGPPGTGKTSRGLMNTLTDELKKPEASVILTAFTNRAVDEICCNLISQGIDFVRLGRSYSASDESQSDLLGNKIHGLTRLDDLKELIARTKVFVGTVTTFNTNISLFQIKQFSLAIVDEASQILEPYLMPMLCAHNNGREAIGKFVLIGDHKQLPAVVQQLPQQSAVTDPELNNILLTDCRLSLFERLFNRYHTNKTVTFALTHQGRMHPEIATFPNKEFYNDALDAVPVEHQLVTLPYDTDSRDGIERVLRTRRIAFVAAPMPDDSNSDKVNIVEARIIASFVNTIYKLSPDTFKAAQTVGVIVPYRNQIATIRNFIADYGIAALSDITIDTVERYQGSQRKYIIYGFTIRQFSQLGFLTSQSFNDVDGTHVDRKLNVAMTRARESLIMVGNPELLANDTTFHKLIEYTKTCGSYFEDTPDNIASGNFTVTPFMPK